jgi:hypothetical protein
VVEHPGASGHDRRWLPWSGAGAALGALLWTTMPWAGRAALGTRPYAGTAFDVGSFVGWLLMLGGLAGAHLVFRDRYGRLGRASTGATGLGMVLVAGLLLGSVLAFVRAGFRPVPATGEDPAGLVLSLAFLLGYGLVFVGAGGLGVALRRAEPRPTLAAGLLVFAALVPFAAVGLRLGSLLPLPVGRLLVRTNAAFVPFGAAWAALGYRVWSETRSTGRGERAPPPR